MFAECSIQYNTKRGETSCFCGKTNSSFLFIQGTEFYEALLQKLQATYRFKLEDFLNTNMLPPDNISRTVKLALLSVQRTMICLGDIARYKEQNHDVGKVNYAKARRYDAIYTHSS